MNGCHCCGHLQMRDNKVVAADDIQTFSLGLQRFYVDLKLVLKYAQLLGKKIVTLITVDIYVKDLCTVLFIYRFAAS